MIQDGSQQELPCKKAFLILIPLFCGVRLDTHIISFTRSSSKSRIAWILSTSLCSHSAAPARFVERIDWGSAHRQGCNPLRRDADIDAPSQQAAKHALREPGGFCCGF